MRHTCAICAVCVVYVLAVLAVLIFPACVAYELHEWFRTVTLPGAYASRLSACVVRACVKHVPCMYLTCDVHVALLPYTYHAACTVGACEMHVAECMCALCWSYVWVMCVVRDCTMYLPYM